MTITTTPHAVEARGLSKWFRHVHAVDGIDLTVPAGGVYAVLGPNGAGKTTLLRMLATLTAPDAGTATVFGHNVADNPRAVRAAIALTGQFAGVDPDLTGWENLVLMARLSGHSSRHARSRASDLVTIFDLGDVARRPVKTYSGGLRRRVDIAATLTSRPRLLFLDEPTTGFDPRSRANTWDLVRDLVAAETTVLLTTQYLEEADRLADRLAVIDSGRIVAEGTAPDLKAAVGAATLDDVFLAVTGRALEPSAANTEPTTEEDR